MRTNKPKVGDIIQRDGEAWEILMVWAKLTPYKRSGQETRVLGYCLGLRKVVH